MKTLLLILVVAASSTYGASLPKNQRIVGGELTTIESYPYAVAMLYSETQSAYRQNCGGAILTSRIILSAAHCYVNARTGYSDPAHFWRARVGSTYANSGGVIHHVRQFSRHPNYRPGISADSDAAVIQIQNSFNFDGITVARGSIAGLNYVLPDNSPIDVVGWGRLWTNGPASEQLRHAKIYTINHDICVSRHPAYMVTENMFCIGILDVGGIDQCQGDSGSPAMHNHVIVGVSSWGYPCADPHVPGVNTKISNLSDWIAQRAYELTNE